MKYIMAACLAITMLIGSANGAELLSTDFEGSTSLPTGWTQQQLVGSRSWKVQTGSGDVSLWSGSIYYPATAHSGTQNACLYYHVKGTKTRLISPVFDSTGYLNLSLSFWHTQWPLGGAGGQDTLRILYSTDGGATWSERAYYDYSITSWTQRTIFLGAPSANSRIAFEGVTNYGAGVCLDDIQVTADSAATLPEVSVSATDAAASEAGTDGGTWTLSRNGSTSSSLTVNFSLSGSATQGGDYSVSDTGSITFAKNQSSVQITLTPVDDSVYDELDETAVLTLTPNAAYGLGAAYQDTITIADDDDAAVRVLVIGSSRDSNQSSSISNGGSSPFDAAAVRDQLDNILSGAGLGGVNVTLIDRSAEGHSADVFSLAQWFHYPYPENVETTTRWPNLSGQGNFAWDYVVLIGDPYTMEKMPGVYAQGVAAVGQEVAKGSAETVLLMPWSVGGPHSLVDHYKDVVYRAGRTGGYKVAPAALAWKDDGYPSDATRCAYISAASIYSRIWGQSAANSSYSYNNALANSVNAIVASNVGATQYSGKFNFKNPFLMLGDPRRDVHYSEKGTSTEEDYKQAVARAMVRCRVSYNSGSYNDKYTSNTPENDGKGWPVGNSMPIAWNHGRKFAETYKEYVTNPAYWQLGMGFTYQSNTWSLPVPTANDQQIGNMFSSEIDLAGYMIEATNEANGQSDSARCIPWRFMWALIHQEYPTLNPLRDGSGPHVNTDLREAVGTYMYTLYSGRCPLDPMPTPMTTLWFAQKVGYETAWRMGNCNSRAPGFKVMPSSATKLTVTPSTTETMTVQFILPPTSDVTVTITSSDTSAAIVGPQTLVFTPSNYNVPQSITVAGVEGTTAAAPFTVDFVTASDDTAYDGLSDSWAYTTTRTATTVTHVDNGTTQYSTPKNFAVTVNLNAPGATSGNTVFAGPNHGTLSWNGGDAVYTPDTDYIGPDGVAYWSLNAGTVTTGYIDVDVIDGFPEGSVRVEATDAEATEAGRTTGTWSVTREGSTAGDLQVYFSIGGTAAPSDYLIDSNSPITIPNGQSSVTVTLTPEDDSEREYPETVTLTITTDAAYTAITNPAAITITDDDNTAPTAFAGADKTVTLDSSALWTPAQVSPVAWYDVSDTGTITLNGSTVSQWADKSGNANHATQETAGSQPTYDSVNNKLVFDGNDIMKVANDPFKGLQNFAVVTIQKWNTNSGWNNASVAYHGESNNGWQVRQRNDGTFCFTVRATGGADDPTSTSTNNLEFLGSCIRKNSSDRVIRQNGTDTYGTTGDTGTIAYNGTNRSSIGGRYQGDSWSSPAGYLRGELKEVIVIENATDDDVQKAEGYLAWKWGLQSELPGDPAPHPYKTGAPGAPAVSVLLSDATVTDPNVGDTLTGTWTVISTPPGGTATFDNENLINATVTLSTVGEYTLRLTGSDGTDTDPDDVVIIVRPPSPEMAVTGQGLEIADDDLTPRVEDDTDFGTVTVGSSVTHTFTIKNDGNEALTLDGTPPNLVDFTATTTDFSIGSQPPSTVEPGTFATFDVTFTPTISGPLDATITIANNDADEAPYVFKVQGNGTAATGATVLATHVFYNNSAWDGNDATAGTADDAARADKLPLLPNGTATFVNYTSYGKGLNGIMVDVDATVPDTLTAADFSFKLGNGNVPSDWAVATEQQKPTTVKTRDIGGGKTRITLIWNDDVIKNTWLQVTVNSGGTIGLTAPYVFYYGNAVSETGNNANNAAIDVFDMLGARNNVTEAGAADILNPYDFNRDKAVDVFDMLGARNNVTDSGNELKLITVP